MKNSHFEDALGSLNGLLRENRNELDSRTFCQIEEIAKRIELGLAEQEDSTDWDELLLRLLDVADQLVKNLPFIAELLRRL